MSEPALRARYASLFKEIKARIAEAQARAVLSVNAELVRLYWDVGRMIDGRQQAEGWGAAVIPRLARELHGELSDAKGFSERNIKRMLAFYREYPDPADISPPAAARLPSPKKGPKGVAHSKGLAKVPQLAAQKKDLAKVPQLAAQFSDALLWTIPWFHHIILIEKVKDRADRAWYMRQTLANGWSRNVLLLMVQSEAHRRQGKAVTNFDRILPAPKSDLVRQALK